MFFNILAISCDDELVKAAIDVVHSVITIIRWGVPLVLIVMCSIDLFKAVASGDEKKTKEIQKTCIKRLVYAVIVFLVPYLINLIFNFVGTLVNQKNAYSDFDEFFACWNSGKGTDSEKSGYCTYPAGNIARTTESACSNANGTFDPD